MAMRSIRGLASSVQRLTSIYGIACKTAQILNVLYRGGNKSPSPQETIALLCPIYQGWPAAPGTPAIPLQENAAVLLQFPFPTYYVCRLNDLSQKGSAGKDARPGTSRTWIQNKKPSITEQFLQGATHLRMDWSRLGSFFQEGFLCWAFGASILQGEAGRR